MPRKYYQPGCKGFSAKAVRVMRRFPGYTNRAMEWDFLTGDNVSQGVLMSEILTSLFWVDWE